MPLSESKNLPFYFWNFMIVERFPVFCLLWFWVDFYLKRLLELRCCQLPCHSRCLLQPFLISSKFYNFCLLYVGQLRSIGTMDNNYSSDEFEPNILNHSLSLAKSIGKVIVNSYGTKNDLFYGYTWPGWLTMIMCFLGALANVFHVCIHQSIFS